MLLYALATFCIVSATGYSVLDEDYIVLESDEDTLLWPDSYSVKATRVSLTSNLLEDYSAWKTNQSSRVDYNKGAVKVSTTLAGATDVHGRKYEVHPETTEEVLNEVVCNFQYEALSDDLELDDILPKNTERYEAVGNETIDEVETVKFELNELSDGDDERNTVWAYYDDEIGWVPVRYERMKYVAKLGSLIVHEIWTYFDFVEGADDDIFDLTEYGCVEATAVKHGKDSEKITKELMFINPENENHVDHVFTHFKNKFGRKYAHEREYVLRKTLFKENMRWISSVNRQNLGYKLGVNQFSDWTPEELKNSHGAIPRPAGSKATVEFPYKESDLDDIVKTLPKEYDMRILGLVSTVKNQESCGSCWTFAATSVTESALAAINGGRVLSLSNQAIVDCAYEELGGELGAGGCKGGFDFAAYDWIMKHGLPTEQEYGPYKNSDDYCKIGNMTKTYPIRGYTEVTPWSNNAMKVALVNHGELFLYVHASKNFQAYSSGIFYQSSAQCSNVRANHAVTVVGYGKLNGDGFWIVKNSWGVNWGVDGYILISTKGNVCGVATHPSYPVF